MSLGLSMMHLLLLLLLLPVIPVLLLMTIFFVFTLYSQDPLKSTDIGTGSVGLSSVWYKGSVELLRISTWV
jgi:hypothetical protein